MNDESTAKAITEAIDEIRRPSEHLLTTAMAAVRSAPRSRQRPRLVAAMAAALAGVLVLTLVGVVALRTRTTPQAAAPGSCSVPVLSDFGSGLLSYPSMNFTPAGRPASEATAYDQANQRWYATVPEGISPDGRLIALHDNLKGDKATMTLENADGRVLFTRDYVNQILGWSQDGSLLFTTIDTDRLAMVSSSGTNFRYIDRVGLGADIWRFASRNSVWGVSPASATDPQHRIFVVRLDLVTRSVTDWFSLVPGSFNDSGGGIVLGLTADGYPIVPELRGDPRAGVLVVRQPNAASELHLADARATSSNFWPYHAFGDAGGIWLTTYDGVLYRSLNEASFAVAQPKNGMHVFALAGRCA